MGSEIREWGFGKKIENEELRYKRRRKSNQGAYIERDCWINGLMKENRVLIEDIQNDSAFTCSASRSADALPLQNREIADGD